MNLHIIITRNDKMEWTDIDLGAQHVCREVVDIVRNVK